MWEIQVRSKSREESDTSSGKAKKEVIDRAKKSPPDVAGGLYRSGSLPRLLLAFKSRLGSRKSSDGHSERRAGDVVQANLVAELDAVRFAAVFAANADLEVAIGTSAPLDADFHQSANAVEVDHLERVLWHEIEFDVVADEAAVVVAAHAETRLRQIIGAEAEELGSAILHNLVGSDAGPGQLDHCADQVAHLDPLLGEDFCRRVVDDLGLGFEFGREPHEWDHNLGLDLDSFLGCIAGRLDDRPSLHFGDLGINDAQPAAAETEHRVEFVESFDSFGYRVNT